MKGLIVEDDEIIRMVIKNYLSKKGHSILEANNGAEGLTIFHKNRDIQYILTDLMMPIMGGIEMAKKIRESESNYNLPIIGITAGKLPIFEIEESSPFNLILEKPVALEDLYNTLLDYCEV